MTPGSLKKEKLGLIIDKRKHTKLLRNSILKPDCQILIENGERIVKVLEQIHYSIIEEEDRRKMTPIHGVVLFGALHVMKILCAGVNCVFIKSKSSYVACVIALRIF